MSYSTCSPIGFAKSGLQNEVAFHEKVPAKPTYQSEAMNFNYRPYAKTNESRMNQTVTIA